MENRAEEAICSRVHVFASDNLLLTSNWELRFSIWTNFEFQIWCQQSSATRWANLYSQVHVFTLELGSVQGDPSPGESGLGWL